MTDGRTRPVAPLPGRILSNGSFLSLLSRRGTGFLVDHDAALTRASVDAPDTSGFAWWARDRTSGATLEIGPRRFAEGGEWLPAESTPGVFTLARRTADLTLRIEVWVDADAPVEWRRITLSNASTEKRTVELTGAAEVVLQSAAADAAHPVFSKLFVQTGWSAEHRALVARRRARDADARHPALAFALDGPGTVEWETDRARFHGRGRSVPRALVERESLSGTTGNVLDPIVALRRIATIGPGETLTWHAWLACGDDSRSPAEGLAACRSADAPVRTRAAAVAAEAARRRAAGLDDLGADAAQDFCVALAWRDPALRAAPREGCGPAIGVLERIGATARDWLIALDAREAAGRAAAPATIALVTYGRSLGLPLVLAVVAGNSEEFVAAPGVVVLRADDLDRAGIEALRTLARAWIDGPLPVLAATAAPHARAASLAIPAPAHDLAAESSAFAEEVRSAETLAHFNGVGGFSSDGREYVIPFARDARGSLVLPPQPWTNVIANPDFGTLVSETGAGFTWSGNSREHRLTPWSNDPLLDPHGEALYVQDTSSGSWWSPQPGPAPAARPALYAARHRAGSSTWTLETPDLSHRTTVFVAADAPVRIARVEITNRGTAARALRIVALTRFVLGSVAGAPGPRTRSDGGAGAVFAWNPFAPDAGDRLAWASVATDADAVVEVGNDLATFLGPDADVARPAALESIEPPAIAARADVDPAAIVSARFELLPGATVVCAFLLGEEPDLAHAMHRLDALRHPGAIDALATVAEARWSEIQSRLTITTPEPAIDLMVNGWLVCQNLSCRLWGRSAFYQSGGAFGFRDQLQDAAALVWVQPEICREQILLHARHQFVEGDVLHWWHPPRSRGLRTRFADDLLWLPLLAAFYVETTGDLAVLEQIEPFLTAPPLAPGEAETYLEPEISSESGTVYEHAARAIDRSLAVGAHGLPLFGCGDWNDGMNRVGIEGRGESVWMAFFLHAVIGAFAPHAERRDEPERAARWRTQRSALEAALEREAWDGEWYRRGWYDDGTPLGSRDSDECRIDALVQAWSVISGAAPAARAEQAMRSVERHLVDRERGILRLLTPPFEHTPHDPGYIKGYVPGVRENGGQYTHAALWAVQAMAGLGWRDRAAAMLAALSPVSHTSTPDDVARYQVEPYVIAADVYGASPHVGRGGWTWYTGSAGWMFRVAIESIFGLQIRGGTTLRLAPCLPDEWRECELRWRMPATGTRLRIRYVAPSGSTRRVLAATLDGVPLTIEAGEVIAALPRDGGDHDLEVTLG